MSHFVRLRCASTRRVKACGISTTTPSVAVAGGARPSHSFPRTVPGPIANHIAPVVRIIGFVFPIFMEVGDLARISISHR
jgi:hypothetical protein